MVGLVALCCCLAASHAAGQAVPDAADGLARQILDATHTRGGLIVHVGCGDGRLTAALLVSPGSLVQGLEKAPAQVDAARQHVRSTGLYGKITIEPFDGRRLPYIDNLVNLLVAEDLGELSMDEVTRVLAPGGAAYVRDGDAWTRTVKPRPPQIDDWTHFLHGPGNNAVAEDQVTGPPRRMQWLAEPLWTRHHHYDKGTQPGFRGLVSSGGRIFYLVDEATAAHIGVPSRWFLVARDAFNGVLLWKLPVAVDDFPRRLEQLWRGLIADGDGVFVSLGTDKPLFAIEPATGRVLREYLGTEGVQEVIKDGNTLLAVDEQGGIAAWRVDTAERLWQWTPREGDEIVPLTMAAGDGRAFVKTDQSVCCLSAANGKLVWRFVPEITTKRRRLAWPRAKLIVVDGVVLCSYGGGDPTVLNRDIWEYLGSHPRVNEYGGTLAALSAEDGNVLWTTAYRPGLESYPGDVFVIDGLVWAGPDFAEGRDLHSGRVERKQEVLEQLWTTGHHHRCYPEKATTRYIFNGKRGVEMKDLTGESHSRNNWLRGTCRLGVTPCNGLLYAPPHSCGCYMEAKLYGFWALAPSATRAAKTPPVTRLDKGPAYTPSANHESSIVNPQSPDWPTYRHDAMRSGSTSSEVPADLAPAWKTRLGGRITPPVIAAGRAVVSCIDSHRVVCLNAQDGALAWQFTTGGRVDSPPTIYGQSVLAGCADGRVYCLRLTDGELVWRFLAAAEERSTVATGRVESLWPVHGSVLVHQGTAYVLAGRSSYLDGGMVLYGLDPASGEVRGRTRLRSEHPTVLPPPSEAEREQMDTLVSQNATDYKTFMAPDRSDAFSMAGARADVLVADGESIYLRNLRFDANLQPHESRAPHLFSTSSLLDDAEIHRSHWAFGTADFSRTPVAYSWIAYKARGESRLSVPYGLMLAVGEETVWGVRRNHLTRPALAKGGLYALFAAERPDADDKQSSLPDFRSAGVKLHWTAPLPLRPVAMVRAGGRLLIGGMTDEFDASDPSSSANAAFEGRGDGRLLVASCDDGGTLSRIQLHSPPVWDGMAVAAGRLYLSDRKGHVLCIGAGR